MQKIKPFLWFDDNAEEAMNFYTSVFPNSKKGEISPYPEGTPHAAGSVMMVNFEIEGISFCGMNAGPQFPFTPAISMYVDCKDQEEVDDLWKKLLQDGGKESNCGWLQDKFGLSWQIVPRTLIKLITDKDPRKAKNVMQAMMTMKKIDVRKIEEAYAAP